MIGPGQGGERRLVYAALTACRAPGAAPAAHLPLRLWRTWHPGASPWTRTHCGLMVLMDPLLPAVAVTSPCHPGWATLMERQARVQQIPLRRALRRTFHGGTGCFEP